MPEKVAEPDEVAVALSDPPRLTPPPTLALERASVTEPDNVPLVSLTVPLIVGDWPRIETVVDGLTLKDQSFASL